MVLFVVIILLIRYLPAGILIILLLRKIFGAKKFKPWEWLVIPLLALYVFVPFAYGAASLSVLCANSCETKISSEMLDAKSVSLRMEYGSSNRSIYARNHTRVCARRCVDLLTKQGLEFVELIVGNQADQYDKISLAKFPQGLCNGKFEEKSYGRREDQVCLRREKIEAPSSKYHVNILTDSSRTSLLNGGFIRLLDTEVSEIRTGKVIAKDKSAIWHPTPYQWHAVFGRILWSNNEISIRKRLNYPKNFDFSRILKNR